MGLFSAIKKLFSKAKSKAVSGFTGKPSMPYPVVEGIDVSHYQRQQNWEQHRYAGIEFAFVNCTDGLNAIDPMYFNHVNNAKKAKVLTGSYHFFKPELDPTQQAEHFVRNSIITELGYVCDWETSGGLPKSVQIANVYTFLKKVEELTGRIPIIYSNSSRLAEYQLDPRFSRYPLWVAHYKTQAPRVPFPWKDYTFWQWTEDYKGVSLDRNYFKGTLGELKAFVTAQANTKGRLS